MADQPIAFMVEYEVIEAWDRYPESGTAKVPVWKPRRALVFSQAEVDALAVNNMYCRNKRVTPLAVADGVSASRGETFSGKPPIPPETP